MEVDKENAPQPGQGPRGAAKHRLSRGELGQLLGQCLKLASENKITSQNTWSLPLIENLPELIKEDDGSGQTNFQRASVTLDAGVKIYSHRVDSVHTETYKILGSMGRSSGTAEEGAGGEGVGGEGEGGRAESGPRRRRAGVELNPDATLEASLEALNVKKFDLAFAVDPLFHKTSQQFDEGGARGLLLNNLSVYRGCEIVFDSMDVPENAVDAAAHQPSSAQVDLSAVQGALGLVRQLSGRERISPTLDEILALLGQAPGEGAAGAAEEFVSEVAAAAGDVRPAPSGSLLQQRGGCASQQGGAGAAPSVDGEAGGSGAEEMEGVEGVVGEAYGGGDPGLAATLGDYGDYDDGGSGDYGGGGFEDAFSDDEGQQSVMQGARGPAPFSEAKKARRNSLGGDAVQWLISAGTSKLAGKAWAGGSHWRYRSAAQQGGGGEGEAEEGEGAEGGRGRKKPRTTRRKNDPLDFVALLEADEQPSFGKLPAAGAARSKAAAKTLLPEDHHYKPEHLAHYSLRPRNLIRRPGSTLASSGAAAAAAYGDGAELGFDDDGGFAGGGFSDDDDAGDGAAGGADFGGWGDIDFGNEGGGGDSAEDSALAGTELLSAPRRVEKVEVNYSKAAKQVDVRALKETLWHGVHQVLPPSGKQRDAELSFQDVLSTVRERNLAGRLEDLSVHLCFICVLHLANEHGLVVRGAEALDRLTISNVPASA